MTNNSRVQWWSKLTGEERSLILRSIGASRPQEAELVNREFDQLPRWARRMLKRAGRTRPVQQFGAPRG